MSAVSAASARRAMTLVEMLIATTMSLIIMGVVAQLFSLLGRSVTDNQSVVTMKEQLRGVAQQLRRDLGGITIMTLPPARPEADAGYLEIIEGAATDISSGTASLNGDCDDVLMFTTKSLGKPFTGLFNGSSIESQYAEVAWFCVPVPLSQQQLLANGTTLYTLYRRQLLSMAYVGAGAFQAKNSISWPGSWDTFYNAYDLSCRYEISTSGTNLFPNSLGDLSKRENRFMHYVPMVSSTFPFKFAGVTTAGATLTAPREGSDVILTNVVGFDVRVYDPSVQIRSQSGSVGLEPDDPGYTGATVTGTGGYVNIGWGAGSPLAVGSTFPSGGQTAFQSAGVRVSNSPKNIPLELPTYDTWSLHYEFNGANEDGDTDSNGVALIDEGTNGQDDNGNGLIDEAEEAETSAPYPVPLRGLEVRIRCYEPSSRQVRQITVRHTFVPH